MNEETGYVCRQCMEKIDEDNYVELNPHKFCCESCLENFLDNHPDQIPTCMDESAVYFGNVTWNREDK